MLSDATAERTMFCQIYDIISSMEIRTCKRHGDQRHFLRKDTPYWRCGKCSSEHVATRRRKVKATLVAEHGGGCQICGYDRYVGSLDFHHVDPTTKEFGIATAGFTRSLDAARREANKCVLLCRNCHGEVEGSVTSLRGSNLGECAPLLTENEVGSNPTPSACR